MDLCGAFTGGHGRLLEVSGLGLFVLMGISAFRIVLCVNASVGASVCIQET